MSDERLLNVFTTWEELSQTSDSIIAYQSRLKAIIDEEAKIDYAEYKGLEKGIERGIEQGQEKGKVEVVLAGAENGLDIPTLAKITGYSEERVQEILDIG